MRTIKEMPYIIGAVLRIYPSSKQKDIISFNDGAGRFIYNRLVANGREKYDLEKAKCFLKPIADRLEYLNSIGTKENPFNNCYPFLNDKRLDAQCIPNALKNYSNAWNHYKKVSGSKRPTFHKKSYEQSYQTNAHYPKDARYITDGNVHFTDKRHITLPKLGVVRFKCSKKTEAILYRTSETRIGTIRIWRNSACEYYVSLQIGSIEPFHKVLPKTGSSLGIDLNISNLYMDSNGNEIPNLHFKKNFQKKLEKAQRKLSKKQQRAKKEKRSIYTSKNYQKQRLKVAQLQLKIKRQREAYQHILSKSLVENQDNIFFEDLKIGNMLKNHKLAYSISDCGWYAFTEKVSYKAALYGKTVLKVPASGTTQTCSSCGYVLQNEEKLTLSDREWNCPKCKAFHIRDENAAINILNKGMKLLNK